MHSPEMSAFIQLVLRWFHIFFGVIWIGHLYFFNFVNVPFQAGLDKDLKPKVNPALLLRALWWFRWGAMWTFVFGWLLFTITYLMGGNLYDADDAFSRRGLWMLVGGLLGSVMWFNVWFVIWPAQKQILGGLLGANPPAPADAAQEARSSSHASTSGCPPRCSWPWSPLPTPTCGRLCPSYLHGVFMLLALGAIHGMLKLAPKKGAGL
jgi:uncharacterized membrane protein